MRKTVTILTFMSLVVACSATAASAALSHGDMEDASSYSVCPGWTYYSTGSVTGALQTKEATTIHGGLASQKLNGTSANAARMGIMQTLTANPGDAFTFDGWVNPSAAATTTYYKMAANWDGSTTISDTLSSYTDFAPTRTAWNHLTGLAGNATTAGGVTLFLDHKRRSNANFSGYWDDISAYQAFVPPAPAVASPTDTSLHVDVTPGGNSGNAAAQYAITIGGGGYTLGTNWVLSNGSVGTTAAWKTDALWDNGAVTGLLPSTTYTFEIVARYSSTVTQATLREGFTGEGRTTPEPATLGLLALGGLAMLRRRR